MTLRYQAHKHTNRLNSMFCKTVLRGLAGRCRPFLSPSQVQQLCVIFCLLLELLQVRQCCAGTPCSSLCTASGNGLTLSTAGVSSRFTVTARDSSGYPLRLSIPDAPLPFSFVASVGASPQSAVVLQPVTTETEVLQGRFTGSYRASLSGRDTLRINMVTCECHFPDMFGITARIDLCGFRWRHLGDVL